MTKLTHNYSNLVDCTDTTSALNLSAMMISNDYQSFNKEKEAVAARRTGTDLEAPGQLHWTPLTFQSPIFKHAMRLIEDPLSPDVQSRMEQMGI
jgi:hypothetical protein